MNDLAFLFLGNNQLDDAEDTISHIFDLLLGKGQEHLVCKSHRTLGHIHRSKGEKTEAIDHFEIALEIAPLFDIWNNELFMIHYDLAWFPGGEDEFDHASAYIERAKLHAANNTYYLAYAMELQAHVLCRQHRLEAKSGASRALEIYEKLGATKDAKTCKDFLQEIEEATEFRSTDSPQ